jgi:hypothetical protein
MGTVEKHSPCKGSWTRVGVIISQVFVTQRYLCTLQVHFHYSANISSNAMYRIQCLNAKGRVGWPIFNVNIRQYLVTGRQEEEAPVKDIGMKKSEGAIQLQKINKRNTRSKSRGQFWS